MKKRGIVIIILFLSIFIISNVNATSLPVPCTSSDGRREQKTMSSGQDAVINRMEVTVNSIVKSSSLKVQTVYNSTSGFNGDKVELVNPDGDVYKAIILGDGLGNIDIEGKSYSVSYYDNPLIENDEYIIFNGERVNKGDYVSSFKDLITVNVTTLYAENLSGELVYIPSNAQQIPPTYVKMLEMRERRTRIRYELSLVYANETSAVLELVTVCENNLCENIWQCSSWGECVSGFQRRVCTELNGCRYTNHKPPEVQKCEAEKEQGFSVKLIRVFNSTVGFSNDVVEFQDSNGEAYNGIILGEGNGEVTITGIVYPFSYYDNPLVEDDEYIIFVGIRVKKGESFGLSQASSSCIENWGCEWGECIDGKQIRICKDLNNCGIEVNKPLSVSRDCNPYVITKRVTPTEETGPVEIPKSEEKEEITEEEKKDICNGCVLEDKCYPFGYRKSGEFCSENKEFTSQLESGEKCENNFECSSNVCVSSQCVSPNLIQKIINWFKRLFSLD